MTIWAFRTIVVPASDVEAARELGAALDPAGAGMYTTPLSPTGEMPATHYMSSGLIDELMVPLLEDGNLLYQYALAGAEKQGLSLEVTEDEADLLVAESDVSTENPFDVMERLGLQLVNERTV